jgi:2-oxoglutarate ferredoxin oxidoreductase subunit gamma
MTQTEVIISGFGGQGAMFVGEMLAHAALEEGRHVTWLPSYGPEMRGGTAHCIVIVSGEEIGSPVVRNPTAAIVMNNPSMEKYEPLVRPGGLLVVNASLVAHRPSRDDIRYVSIPASSLAEEAGGEKLANMVLLGAALEALPIVEPGSVVKVLGKHISERHRHLLEANARALRAGAQAAAPHQKETTPWPR